MQNRDSILMHPFAFISLAVMTVSTPLGAQIVGDRVRVFSGDTTIVGQITGLSDEGFEFANGRSVAYLDLDRVEVSDGIGTPFWGHELAVIGSVLGLFAGFRDTLEDENAINSAFEGSLLGSLLGLGTGALWLLSPWSPPWLLSPHNTDESWKPIPVRGGRVRVSVDGSEIIGRATAMTDEGFELVQGGMRRSVAYRDIDGLEWSRGMRSRWKTGWGLGLLAGFIAFPTFNGAWGCVASDWEGPSCEEKGEDSFAWIGAGGLLGLGVGTLVWRRESWKPFALHEDRLGISPFVVPQRGPAGRHGLLLGARIEF